MAIEFLKNKNEFDKKIKNISSILLDFDGTLVDYVENENLALGNILTNHKIDVSIHNKIILEYRSINEKLWKLYEKKEITVDEVRLRRFQELTKIFNLQIDPNLFNDLYIENFSKFVVPFPGIEKSLLKFKSNHPRIKLIILTNGINSTQVIRREKAGLVSVTDSMITSDQAGIAKPSPEIYNFTEKLLGIKISESIMIGDSLSSDIQGAINMDIPSVYVESNLHELDKEELYLLNPKPDMVTSSCIEFLEYISKTLNSSSI